MIDLLIAAGSVGGYLAVGVLYARSQSVKCLRMAKARNEHWFSKAIAASYTREQYRVAICARVFAWPVVGISGLISGPIDTALRDAEEHAKTAEFWRERVREAETEGERAMASELASMYSRMAKEAQL